MGMRGMEWKMRKTTLDMDMQPRWQAQHGRGAHSLTFAMILPHREAANCLGYMTEQNREGGRIDI